MGWGRRERTNIQCTQGALKKQHCLCSTSTDSGLIDLERVPGMAILKGAFGLSIKINNGSIGL